VKTLKNPQERTCFSASGLSYVHSLSFFNRVTRLSRYSDAKIYFCHHCFLFRFTVTPYIFTYGISFLLDCQPCKSNPKSSNVKIDISGPFALNFHFLVKSSSGFRHCVWSITYIEVLSHLSFAVAPQN
jgi:hypothetical protein